MGKWIEGKTLAQKIRDEAREEVALFKRTKGKVPGLAAVLVGDDEASQVYVRTKERSCEKLGIYSEVFRLPEKTSQSQLISKIGELNRREEIDGILVQLPLPPAIDPHKIITSILPEKDVDGFHPYNLGRLMMNQEGMRPCTPLGIIELLKYHGIPLEGKRAVIIGRSLIVGKPLAAMMTNENATVTICHSRTESLSEVAAEADILVAAMGRAAFVTPDFVKEGATVVDVGMNNLTDTAKVKEMFGGDEKREQDLATKGYTLIGDVDPRAITKAAYMTPVPGGVGPLTVAMLMRNTLEAFKKRRVHPS